MQGIVVLTCVLKATYGRTVYRYLGQVQAGDGYQGSVDMRMAEMHILFD